MNDTTQSAYGYSFLLLGSIVLGGLAGYFFAADCHYLKPIGDVFINLILTAIVPLLFFSITLAIAKISQEGRLAKIMSAMLFVFVLTGVIAALSALIIVFYCLPINQSIQILPLVQDPMAARSVSDIATLFTVPEFGQLFTHKHMLALIVFSILLGLAVNKTDKATQAVLLRGLQIGEILFTRVVDVIMYLAPLGFFSYFAVLISELGPQLVTHYLHITGLYYGFGLIYFIIGSTCFAYLAAGKKGIRAYWQQISLPALTALATCSSAACIPSNIQAVKAMGVSDAVADALIPIGSLTHKIGSVIGGLFKIAFLFGLYHLDFSGLSVLIMAIGVSLLVGTVMGAIPGGGMLGEMLILTVYGFPSSVLITIAAISILIDPLATMLNVTGNSYSSMLVSRLIYGKSPG
ncbi:MAG: sodium:proton antiporter [Legionella sp.]|nr:MAG: sodium:proton antiporter [Legionella sp.]PJD99875.1 MAG: sodium:proton antiporter [Legionella sp.]